MADEAEIVAVAGREVRITHPGKPYFPEAGLTKGDLARYWLAVSEPALRAVRDRPLVLKRYPKGLLDKPFYQKRAPKSRPDWVDTAVFSFPSGRTAEEVVVRDAAQLLWVVNLGCIDLNPLAVRAPDLEHPDELRIDLDPVPGVPWSQILEVTLLVREVLEEHGLVGWPKTSGSRGMHVYARIAPWWEYQDVRRAALAVAREVEKRAPGRASSAWWKEEREGVFLDYNQNARDRTTASAWSVRAVPDARVSMPLRWEEVPGCDPAAFTLKTVPALLAEHGDPHAEMDAHTGSLESLLELAQGQEDAPWPPHFPKQKGEPPRVQPSRRKPVITIAQSEDHDAALAGLERWKAKHPEVVSHLKTRDVLVDKMRGRYTTWTRVRINLEHVPEPERPAPEPPDPDDPP